MKKIYELIMAGTSLVPAYTIWAYFIFIGLDIFTTYLASPDLKYESNWIINAFNFSFLEIIIIASIFGIVLSSTFLIANAVVKVEISERIRSHNLKILLSNKKVLSCFLLICIFYSHFFISVFVTINNYLNYLFLINRNEHILHFVAINYVKFESIFFPNYYIYSQSFFILSAFLYSAIYLKKYPIS